MFFVVVVFVCRCKCLVFSKQIEVSVWNENDDEWLKGNDSSIKRMSHINNLEKIIDFDVMQ